MSDQQEELEECSLEEMIKETLESFRVEIFTWQAEDPERTATHELVLFLFFVLCLICPPHSLTQQPYLRPRRMTANRFTAALRTQRTLQLPFSRTRSSGNRVLN